MTILDKIFRRRKKKKKKEIKQNWIKVENFDNYFCVIFDHYYKSFVSRKKTGC